MTACVTQHDTVGLALTIRLYVYGGYTVSYQKVADLLTELLKLVRLASSSGPRAKVCGFVQPQAAAPVLEHPSDTGAVGGLVAAEGWAPPTASPIQRPTADPPPATAHGRRDREATGVTFEAVGVEPNSAGVDRLEHHLAAEERRATFATHALD